MLNTFSQSLKKCLGRPFYSTFKKCMKAKGIFRTLLKIWNSPICENSYCLKAVNYIRKKLELGCLTGLWIGLTSFFAYTKTSLYNFFMCSKVTKEIIGTNFATTCHNTILDECLVSITWNRVEHVLPLVCEGIEHCFSFFDFNELYLAKNELYLIIEFVNYIDDIENRIWSAPIFLKK